MLLLAGDIGGTKTNLAIYSPQTGPRRPLVQCSFASAEHASLETLAEAFLAQAGRRVTHASLGVAGPVVDGRVKITNLPWRIDAEQLRVALGLEAVELINDLVAIANGIPALAPEDLHTLNQGQPAPAGAIAVIAPGTGLGEAFLTWDGTRYRPQPSEGGHADMAPRTTQELELLRYLLPRYRHISWERVCSGLGLPNIYAFVRDSGLAQEPPWLAAKLAAAADPTPIIVGCALEAERPCPICQRTLELFVSLLGAEAGNLALKVLASGGVYLGGGIPPRILPALGQGAFMRSFVAKGRMGEMLERWPVHVIVNPEVALMGAAARGLSG